MNSFKNTIKELKKEKSNIDIDGAEKQAWLSSRCTKSLIMDLTSLYLDDLNSLPSLSTATDEGREESDMMKGRIALLETILDEIAETPEEEE